LGTTAIEKTLLNTNNSAQSEMDQDELCLITLNDDENSDSEFDQKYADFCNATALCELEMNSPDCNGIVP